MLVSEVLISFSSFYFQTQAPTACLHCLKLVFLADIYSGIMSASKSLIPFCVLWVFSLLLNLLCCALTFYFHCIYFCAVHHHYELVSLQLGSHGFISSFINSPFNITTKKTVAEIRSITQQSAQGFRSLQAIVVMSLALAGRDTVNSAAFWILISHNVV